LVSITAAGFEVVSDFEFRPEVPVTDAFVENCLMSLFREAINDYPSGALYGDSVASAVSVHFLYRYGVRKVKSRELKGGLSKEALKLVMDYIEENASRQIRLSELAALAHLSPFHFSRLFKTSTGLSPYQYLMRTRVEIARRLMNKGNLTMKEVARSVGFYDASHFSRIFKRVTGVKAAEVFKQVDQ
jgi:AraC family transcriptional regulator